MRRIKYLLPRANRLRKPYIRANHAVIPYHRIPAEYGSVSVNSGPVADIRMPLAALDRVPAAVLIKRTRTYRNPLVQLYMGPYTRGLTYHHTGTMVYTEILANRSPGIDIDPCFLMCELRHDPWYIGDTQTVEYVRDPIDECSVESRIAYDDLRKGRRCGIPVIDRPDISHRV